MMNKWIVVGLLAIGSAGAQIPFSDYTVPSGIQHSGFDLSWDVAVGDINNDGLPEIYCMSHNQGSAARVSILYKSSSSLVLTNITATAFAGVSATGGGQGAFMVDLDGDKYIDLITGSNDGVGCVFRNVSGIFSWYANMPDYQGHFYAREMCAGDMDGDGDLDLVVAHCRDTAGMYRNNGNGVYSSPVNFPTAPGAQLPFKLADPIACDLDNDGKMDLISQRISCFGTWPSGLPLTADFWKGDGHGVFTWKSDAAALDSGGEQSAFLVGDFENKGALDIVQLKYLANQGPSKFYLNDGAGHFTEEAVRRGLSAGSAYGTYYMKGAVGDFDNDGDLDILYYGDIWINDGTGHFTKSHLGFSHAGGIVATADLDGDGDLDIVGTGDSGFCVYRNNTDNNAWLKVRVSAGAGNPWGVGSKIFVYNGSTLIGYRQVICSSAMQQPMEQHFGIGSAAMVRVKVVFPNGVQKEVSGLSAGKWIVIDSSTVAAESGWRPPNGVISEMLTATRNPLSTVVWFHFLTPYSQSEARPVACNKGAPELAIFDFSGKLIAKLKANSSKNVGTALFSWNTGNRNPGAYVARLFSGGRPLTKRIFLEK
jgi:hypothetical protein